MVTMMLQRIVRHLLTTDRHVRRLFPRNALAAIERAIKDSEIAPYHKSFYKTLMQHELLFSVFPYQDLDNQAYLKHPKGK